MHWIWSSIAVFLTAVVVDLAWAIYIRRTAAGNALQAAHFSVVIMLAGAFNTFSFVKRPLLLLPIALGAWLGTYLVVHYEHREERRDS